MFILNFLFILNLFANVSSEVYPKIEYPDRHIIFQAGKMGHKPWDPHASYGVQVNFNSAVFNKLLYIDANYKIHPGIFKDWSWKAQTNSYLFTIDDQFKFDDKRKINAKDIEFAILKVFLSPEGSNTRPYLMEIKGISSLTENQKFKSGLCKGIKVISDLKLEVYLNKPNPNFIYSLGDAVPLIAPIEDFKEDLYNFKDIPRGTGSYYVSWSSSKNSLIRLTKKNIRPENLNNGRYPLSIDFINNGEPVDNKVDLAAEAGTSGIRESKDYKIILGQIPDGINSLQFNYENNLSKNKLLREAISLALDRKKIFEKYIQMTPSYEVIPSMYYGRSETKTDYNPLKSKEIIKNNFSNISSPQKPLSGIYHGQKNKPLKPHIIEITKQLKDVGLYIEFIGTETVDFKDYSNALIREVGMASAFVDPLSSFALFSSKINSKNKNFYINNSDTIVTKLFTSAQDSKNREERAEKIKALSKYFQSEHLVIPLAESRVIYALGKKIEDIDIQNVFSALNFEKIKLNAK